MLRLSFRAFLLLGAVFAAPRNADAQIAFTYDYTTSSTANPSYYSAEFRSAISGPAPM